FQVGANAGQTIQATTANFRTNNYGNNEISTTSPTTLATTGTAYTAGTFALQGLATKNINVTATDTAQTLAASINGASATTGVTADAKTEEAITLAPAGVYSLAVTSDNSSAANVTFTVGAAANAAGLASAVSAFNDVSSKTGVTAKLNSTNDGLILTNAAGNNITIANNSASASVTAASVNAAGVVGTSATVASGATSTSMGYVSMNSDKGFSIGTSSATGAVVAGAAATLNSVSGIDVSTSKGASDALKVLDSALANVNSQRASFGALQSRFETAVTNLQSTSENLSASRSRIQDTDFASETAKLTRGQILQQAGTAMLAQANQLPNGVLSLLRG
ncbi:MAG TPA: flagellin, partial [Telluria sp.]